MIDFKEVEKEYNELLEKYGETVADILALSEITCKIQDNYDDVLSVDVYTGSIHLYRIDALMRISNGNGSVNIWDSPTKKHIGTLDYTIENRNFFVVLTKEELQYVLDSFPLVKKPK